MGPAHAQVRVVRVPISGLQSMNDRSSRSYLCKRCVPPKEPNKLNDPHAKHAPILLTARLWKLPAAMLIVKGGAPVSKGGSATGVTPLALRHPRQNLEWFHSS